MSDGPALVVLAAGASRRLGTCKAVVRLREREPASPLALLLDAWVHAVVEDRDRSSPAPLVVTGEHDAEIRAVLEGLPLPVEVVHNPAWARGRSGGVLLARDRRPGRDLCLAPVDVPLVRTATFLALRDAWARAGRPGRGWLAPWTRAPHGDAPDARVHGHPVIVGRELLSAWNPRSDTPLSELRAAADPLLAAEVDDAGILEDLDTPEDLEALRQRLSLL